MYPHAKYRKLTYSDKALMMERNGVLHVHVCENGKYKNSDQNLVQKLSM